MVGCSVYNYTYYFVQTEQGTNNGMGTSASTTWRGKWVNWEFCAKIHVQNFSIFKVFQVVRLERRKGAYNWYEERELVENFVQNYMYKFSIRVCSRSLGWQSAWTSQPTEDGKENFIMSPKKMWHGEKVKCIAIFVYTRVQIGYV